MADNSNNLPASSKDLLDRLAPQKSTEFTGILQLLGREAYVNVEQIGKYEQQVYALLKTNPQDVDGLVTFLRIQLMLGNHQKAKSIAYRIWEIGGSLKNISEKSFINDLINLGLLEMASILLKPYFETMAASIKEYGALFLKYAIASGNLNVMEKITLLLPEGATRRAMADFIGVYKFLNYGEAFKNMQRMVIENVKDTLCAYEYILYMDRGFTDMEIILYVGNETTDLAHLKQIIDLQTASACSAKGVKKLNNLGYVVKSIKEYSQSGANLQG